MFLVSLILRWLWWFSVGIIHKIILRINWEFEREIVGVKNACFFASGICKAYKFWIR